TQDITAPKLTLSSAPSLTCLITTAQIFATSDSGATFSWTGPGIVGSTSSNSITLNAAGNYTVIATGANGCTATASVTVTQNITAPVLACGSAPVLNCLITSTQISVQSGINNTYLWTGPGIVGSNTGSSITVNAPGTYVVVATDATS